MSKSKNLALIGIDGGSWNVLQWLISKGYMPNLGHIVEKYIYGNLKSTIPPVTGAAWLSMATGLNPGKTGVIDFFKHINNFILELVSSNDYQDKSIWDYLSLLGNKIAILDYPMLYPAYPINGIMVSSWGGKFSIFPTYLINELKSIVEEYSIFVDYHLEKYNDINLFFEDLNKAIEKKVRISKFFMKKSWDLFIDVFSFTDWLQHRIWHYIDPSHPLYPGDKESVRYKKKFAEYWQIIDEYIGEVNEIYSNILIVSDHGFGPQWGVFNPIRWLLIHGFTKQRNDFVKHFIDLIKQYKIYRLIPKKFYKKAHEHGLSLLNPSFRYNIEDSKAIVLDYTIPFGAIHINPKLKNHYNEILEEITQRLYNLDKELHKSLNIRIWKAKDLYHGDKVNLLPDLIFTINDWSCVMVNDIDKKFVYRDTSYSPRHTGSHRIYGIFIASGSDFKKSTHMIDVSILDIAPTILYMFDAPIPNNMDGRVLRQILVYGREKEPIYVSPLWYRMKKIKKYLRKRYYKDKNTKT